MKRLCLVFILAGCATTPRAPAVMDHADSMMTAIYNSGFNGFPDDTINLYFPKGAYNHE